MVKTKGFTLIELVIVIIILGILAVTAFSKFINISSNAKLEALDAIAASIKSAADLSRNKAIIKGVEKNSRSSPNNPPFVQLNNGILELRYGYPESFAEETNGLDIVDMIDITGDIEICYGTTCQNNNSSRLKIGYDTTEDTGCYVRYVEPGGTDNPEDEKYLIEKITAGC